MNKSQFKLWFRACRRLRWNLDPSKPHVVGSRDGVQYRKGFNFANGLARVADLPFGNRRGEYFERLQALRLPSVTGKNYRRLEIGFIRDMRERAAIESVLP